MIFASTEAVVHEVLGAHVKQFECAYHITMVANSIKGAVSRYPGGNELVNKFLNLVYSAESEEALMSEWNSFAEQFSSVPVSAYKYVLVAAVWYQPVVS